VTVIRRSNLRRCSLLLAFVPLFALPAGPAQSAWAATVSQAEAGDLLRYRNTGQQLYEATSVDADTFMKAVALPEVRQEVERVFKRKLTDEQLLALSAAARAEADYWRRYVEGIDKMAEEQRRISGEPGPVPFIDLLENPLALLPPPAAASNVSIATPDRWRILDALGRKENPLDPYNTNTLKADKPIFGEDWFLNIGAISDTLYEPARVPVPVSGISPAKPGENNTFGRYSRLAFNQTEIVTVSLIRGNTAYKPPEIELRFTPAYNFNHTEVGELGIININPQKGLVRDQSFLGMQEGFIDYHIRNVSEYYDFDSVRVGIQPFNADFRGFVFQDNQLGIRFFGDRDDNRWQYNLAFFRRLEKDTNSGLNSLGQALRKDDVFVANLFRQDFPVPGFTSQIVYLRNNNFEDHTVHYDRDGFLVTPAQIGDNRGYSYDVNYLGLNGDGHFGRINLTGSAYWAFGHLSHNQFSPDPQNDGAHINAFFAAAEPSIDFDFVRVRGSGVFQSGDSNPKGGHATGFDSIFENPQIAGSDTSYFIRQSIPFIGGGGVGLNQPNGILADLRSSKLEGQSNFINPGLLLAGVGTDTDILPELRLSTNFNYLRFVDVAPLKFLRNQGNIAHEIGYDLSAALTWRPLDTQNIIFRASAAVLLPGDGLRSIYNTSQGLFSSSNILYSTMINMILAY
jgi:hypothetical protein